MITIRVEEDEDITLLLKRHNKYKLEYNLNVSEQGYTGLVMEKFVPAIMSIVMAGEVMKVVTDTFKEKGL